LTTLSIYGVPKSCRHIVGYLPEREVLQFVAVCCNVLQCVAVKELQTYCWVSSGKPRNTTIRLDCKRETNIDKSISASTDCFGPHNIDKRIMVKKAVKRYSGTSALPTSALPYRRIYHYHLFAPSWAHTTWEGTGR